MPTLQAETPLDAPSMVCAWPDTLLGETSGSIRPLRTTPQWMTKNAWPNSSVPRNRHAKNSMITPEATVSKQSKEDGTKIIGGFRYDRKMVTSIF